MVINVNSKANDNLLFSSGYVTKDQPGWRFIAKQERKVMHEDRDDCEATKFSRTTDVDHVQYIDFEYWLTPLPLPLLNPRPQPLA